MLHFGRDRLFILVLRSFKVEARNEGQFPNFVQIKGKTMRSSLNEKSLQLSYFLTYLKFVSYLIQYNSRYQRLPCGFEGLVRVLLVG